MVVSLLNSDRRKSERNEIRPPAASHLDISAYFLARRGGMRCRRPTVSPALNTKSIGPGQILAPSDLSNIRSYHYYLHDSFFETYLSFAHAPFGTTDVTLDLSREL